jgi:hypothetical protein
VGDPPSTYLKMKLTAGFAALALFLSAVNIVAAHEFNLVAEERRHYSSSPAIPDPTPTPKHHYHPGRALLSTPTPTPKHHHPDRAFLSTPTPTPKHHHPGRETHPSPTPKHRRLPGRGASPDGAPNVFSDGAPADGSFPLHRRHPRQVKP